MNGPDGFEPTEKQLFRIAQTINGKPAAILVSHAVLRGQLHKPLLPIGRFLIRDEAHPEQRIMSFFGRLWLGPGFLTNALDGSRVESADGVE
jgi:hypothetical protein